MEWLTVIVGVAELQQARFEKRDYNDFSVTIAPSPPRRHRRHARYPRDHF